MSNILIIGTGAWGTALASVLLENKHKIKMFGKNEQQVKDLLNGYNNQFFPGTKLNSKIESSLNIQELLTDDLEYLILAIPSKQIVTFLEENKSLISKNIKIINSSKGIDIASGKNYFDVIRKIIPNEICAIAGNSFAVDVINKSYTFVNIISKDSKLNNEVCNLFNNQYFKTKGINDENGSSYISALKNSLAIICGILDYKNISINTITTILNEGINEIDKISKIFNKDNNTIFEPCGIADIILTCTDKKSRNFQFGLLVGEYGIQDALIKNTQTIEGVGTINNVYNLIKNEIALYPILESIYKIVNNKIIFEDLINYIWERIN